MFLEFLLIVLGLVALSVGVIYGESYLSKSKNVYMGLIPCGAVSVASYLTLLIMLLADSGWYALLTFFLLQIPVVIGVIYLFRSKMKQAIRMRQENQRQMKLQNARRLEGEKQIHMNLLLRGFRCAESGMKVEGQREIVILSRSGHTSQEIAQTTGASVEDVEQILAAYERYCHRADADESTSTDRILTMEQEETIVNYLVNSTPAENQISASLLWNRTTVRAMASQLLGMNLSTRMVTAYLTHWGLTVPEKQTIRSRSSDPDVHMWIVSEYDRIRKLASDHGGEIIWIYTVIPEKIQDISTYVPKDPIMLCAVSVEGSVAFRVYDRSLDGYFNDFVASITAASGSKLYAIVNEDYDEYMSRLGRDRRRALTDKIEFFRGM
jgi:transposase